METIDQFVRSPRRASQLLTELRQTGEMSHAQRTLWATSRPWIVIQRKIESESDEKMNMNVSFS